MSATDPALFPVPSGVAERFWAKVDKRGDCWLWTAAHTHEIPAFAIGGTIVDARRAAWEFSGRGSLAGLTLSGRAECPRDCVNPDHKKPKPSVRGGKSVLAIMAEQADVKPPKLARFNTSLITGPGGPNGSRYAAPDDVGPVAVEKVKRVISVNCGYCEWRNGKHRRDCPMWTAPVAAPTAVVIAPPTVVGPFGSGGFVAITPWGTFNADSLIGVCAAVEAGKPLGAA